MDKTTWHKVYKESVFKHFDNECKECFKEIKLHDGVVHHKTYKHKGGIYNTSAKELIDCRKITVLCHECHELEHQTKSIDGITRLLDVECIECFERYPKEDMINGKCDICFSIELQTFKEYEY